MRGVALSRRRRGRGQGSLRGVRLGQRVRSQWLHLLCMRQPR